MARYSFAPRRALSTARGGLFALSWPVITLALSFGSMQGTAPGITDTTTSATAALMLLMALPTMALFLVLELSPEVAAVAAAATALPLWFLAGMWLAARASSWPAWWRRYALVSVGWAVLSIVLLAIAATMAE